MYPSFPDRFNMADYFLYHNLEEGRENKVCLYYEDRQWTYGEVARLSNRTGNALRELGANIEDRVLMVLPDCPEFVWTWFGAARIGAVITMVNPLLPAADYEYYLDYTRAKVAVVHHSLLKTFGEAAATARYLRSVLVVGRGGHGGPPLQLNPSNTTQSNRVDDTQSNLSNATQSNLGDITPSNRGDATPSNLGDVTPSNRGDATPSNLGDVTQLNRGDVTPSNLGDVTPSNLGDVTQLNRGDATPSNLVDPAQSNCGDATPSNRVDAIPSNRGDGPSPQSNREDMNPDNDLVGVALRGHPFRENVNWVEFNDVINAASDDCPRADTRRDDIAIWLFTSGSTGHPKGAVHLQHDLPFNTEVFAKATMGVCADDLTVSVPKLFFGYATGTNLLFPFAVGGATALFSERSTAEKMFEVIKRYRPTILTTVPTMINSMLNVPGASAEDVSSLRFCYSAGEALPKELYERWMNAYGVDICDGIGSAEMFHIYITNRPGDIKPGSLGRIVDGYEAKIVDADSKEVATGEMGTLKIKGDSAALCYWNAHEKSKETFAGDWCTTGDQFHVDADGYYWYHGRTDDMLKVSGVFVAPAEIENCLLQHEAVLECAVVGHESEGLVKPKAFLVLREGFTAGDALGEQIKQFVKERIAIYKYPRWVEFVDSLPKNDRGKIDRRKLKT